MGIRTISPAYSTLLIKPQPGSLTHANIRIPSIKGPISVAFNATVESFSLVISLPPGCRAKACLPKLGISNANVKLDGHDTSGSFEGDYVCLEGIGSNAKSAPHVLFRGTTSTDMH
jgi:alpha-L-rhamnosidase